MSDAANQGVSLWCTALAVHLLLVGEAEAGMVGQCGSATWQLLSSQPGVIVLDAQLASHKATLATPAQLG
jgi:hypothetical protein